LLEIFVVRICALEVRCSQRCRQRALKRVLGDPPADGAGAEARGQVGKQTFHVVMH
jgi:hypothetical protein